ncbi:MAG: hypothetical protein JSV79_09280 [Armatimonadota bacterium]|nr:MAG: hypothetical protein JSV79_09280 [Armatimonadota bacterium]
MTGAPVEALTILKEYGLAGVMAWLFWWTLRRTMASHDAAVHELKGQLDTQAQATQAAGERFAHVVENHMNHVCNSLARFGASLSHQAEEQRRWQDRLLETMERIAAHLTADRSG